MIGICTYQESDNIENLIRRLFQALPEAVVLVVDDNSPDGTADVVRRLQAEFDRLELVVRTDARGLGSAIVRAMREAVDRGLPLFLNLDADLSHDPSELPQLLDRAIADPSLDVVIGSRYVDGGKIVGWPLRRRLMSKFVNRFATGVLGLPVKDCSGSMRCYRTAALQRIGLDSLQCTGYAVLEELLVKFNRSGGKMAELPITFVEREHGHSKLSLAEAVRSIGFMMRLAVQSRR
ncbi:polyprenol monophosphomannose synthase [Roseiconus nitratireducens]|uniref:Polyprenol monophosphomannose synthase n=2 Tax=Roseiconus nitratireducens TaxID=2605748 RepID=A0A5M6D381_9BACT|nr:polyprenol monophosphomannose synthase [Roseiconus nitratireducens]